MRFVGLAFAVLAVVSVPRALLAQLYPGDFPAPGSVTWSRECVPMPPAPGPPLEQKDNFGASIAVVRGLAFAGTCPVAVGTPGDDTGGKDAGAVRLVGLDKSGEVVAQRLIANGLSGLGQVLPAQGRFGSSLASLGDLDGNGVEDLAVGAPVGKGAVHILFLEADGTVKSHIVFDEDTPSLGAQLQEGDEFGAAVSAAGDVDGDGDMDLAVGAPSTPGAVYDGAIYLLLLGRAASLDSWTRIAATDVAGCLGPLLGKSHFGRGIAGLGMLEDGDQVPDLAVCAGGSYGMLILHLTSWGQLKTCHSEFVGSTGGDTVALVGDYDRNGQRDLASGATKYGYGNKGAVDILLLSPAGVVIDDLPFGAFFGGFSGVLAADDHFGSVGSVGDLDGDGVADLAVGAAGNDDAALSAGSVWFIGLNATLWSEEGDGLPSLPGGYVPYLGVEGTIAPDSSLAIKVFGKTPDLPVFVVAGSQPVNLPVLGGTLVPLPELVAGGQVTDAAGDALFAGRWPATAPPGMDLWVQFWIEGGLAPAGWAASRGLHGDAP